MNNKKEISEETQAKIFEIIDEIKKRTEKDAIKILLDSETKPSVFDSKIGGIPYWDRNKDYPATENGNKLILLAQFNMEQLPENNIFPKEGMLQFFILDDDLYGMPYGDDCEKETYKVVFHNKIDTSFTEKEAMSMNIHTTFDALNDDDFSFPVYGEFAVKFEKTKVWMDCNDIRFENIAETIAKEKGFKHDEDKSVLNLIYDMDIDDLFVSSIGHWLCGYPYFTQYDPRTDEEAQNVYNTVLFQLDSDWDNEHYKNKEVMWGDAGVGAFFINDKKLAALEFDDVLYNWDCG